MYLFLRNSRPKSIETAKPGMEGRFVRSPQIKPACHSPPERNIICTVRGTENANAQLFKRDPAVMTRTCKNHRERGTCRGFNRGRKDDLNSRKEGRDWMVTNAI